MDIKTLTKLFMWCTIIDAALLLLSTAMFMFAPDLAYRVSSNWFSLSRESFQLVMYLYVGLFKIVFLVFNVVPYAALLIVGREKRLPKP